MPSENYSQWGRGGDYPPDQTRVQPAVDDSAYDQWGVGQQPQYIPGAPQRREPSAPRKRSKDGWITVGILLLIVAVIIGLGVFLYKNYFSGDDASSAAGTGSSVSTAPGEQPEAEAADSPSSATATTTATSSSRPSTSAPSASKNARRPRDPQLPEGAIPANDAARRGAPAGDFNNVHRGTTITSEPFAQAVRDSFVEYYLDNDKTEGTVKAYSSVTGQYYTMRCADNGDYVTCRGGNDAVVYIS